jgi:hypothetical protein
MAAPGQLRLLSGEVIRLQGQWMAKSKPAEVALPGGGYVRLHASTDASVLTDPQNLMLLPGQKTVTYTVILRRGLVDVDLPPEGKSRIAVVVSTPSDLRLLTLSGQSSYRVDGRAVQAVNQSGLATVAHGSKLVRLPSAVKRTFNGSSAPADRPLLDATRWIGGRRIWIASQKTPIPISGYVWEKVEGAESYAVELRDLETHQVVTRSRVTQTAMEAALPPLAPGRYEFAVSGVDRDGFVSNNWMTIPVRVVGLELPGGACLLPKDTVLVAPEQRVRLTNAEGLTLTTADHRSGVPATEPFGLAGLDRAAVLIHPPGGGDTSTVTLLRREPSVSAWVGPKLATWPEDPVELQVSFIDDHGRPTPHSVVPTVRVFVGVDPVDVAWDKHDGLWQAKLSPVKVAGPWVVRLEVVDQFGVVIGRDFAEIAKTRPRKPAELDLDKVSLSPRASAGHSHAR